MSTTATAPGAISLMAAGQLRDAMDALQHGDRVTAVSALMAIDTESWDAIEHRLSAVGGSLPELLAVVRGQGDLDS